MKTRSIAQYTPDEKRDAEFIRQMSKEASHNLTDRKFNVGDIVALDPDHYRVAIDKYGNDPMQGRSELREHVFVVVGILARMDGSSLWTDESYLLDTKTLSYEIFEDFMLIPAEVVEK